MELRRVQVTCKEKMERIGPLMVEREAIEKEIASIAQQLIDLEAKNVHKNLIDKDGFPRENLDFGELTAYKNLKRRNNELQNDYNNLMKKIENELFEYHRILRESGAADAELNKIKESQKQAQTQSELINFKKGEAMKPVEKMEEEEPQKKEPILPFAKINELTSKSPSEQDGIRLGDLIIKFGSANYYNNNKLALLSEIVKANTNLPIPILLIREPGQNSKELVIFEGKQKEILNLDLTPRSWDGPGLLG